MGVELNGRASTKEFWSGTEGGKRPVESEQAPFASALKLHQCRLAYADVFAERTLPKASAAAKRCNLLS